MHSLSLESVSVNAHQKTLLLSLMYTGALRDVM